MSYIDVIQNGSTAVKSFFHWIVIWEAEKFVNESPSDWNEYLNSIDVTGMKHPEFSLESAFAVTQVCCEFP